MREVGRLEGRQDEAAGDASSPLLPSVAPLQLSGALCALWGLGLGGEARTAWPGKSRRPVRGV